MTTESLHPKDASIYRDCPDCGDVFIGTAGEVCQDCEDLANWKPPCDQCEAIGINGLLCHETGCPNTPRDDEGGE